MSLVAAEEEGKFLGKEDSGLVISQGNPQEIAAISLMLPRPRHPQLRE